MWAISCGERWTDSTEHASVGNLPLMQISNLQQHRGVADSLLMIAVSVKYYSLIARLSLYSLLHAAYRSIASQEMHMNFPVLNMKNIPAVLLQCVMRSLEAPENPVSNTIGTSYRPMAAEITQDLKYPAGYKVLPLP